MTYSVRYVFSISAAAALLAGCGGSQPPLVARGTMPQSQALQSQRTPRADHGRSWMAPNAVKLRSLLYVTDGGDNDVYVFSLPHGTLVGILTGFLGVVGVCSDKTTGNVFVVDFAAAAVKEYRHGGNEPVAILNDPNALPLSCSVDPTTGNLAVTNQITLNSDRDEPGDVAIYAKAHGKPRTYSDPAMIYVNFDSYDGSGNLYVSGGSPNSGANSAFALLPKGGGKLERLTLNQKFCCNQASALQWDGRHLAVADQTSARIYQFTIRRRRGTQVGTTWLVGATSVSGFWVQNDQLYAPVISDGQPMVGFYPYPSGGRPTKALLGFAEPFGATVSVNP